MVLKLYNLVAIATLALLGITSLGPTPVNALSTHAVARSPRSLNHNALARKKKRSGNHPAKRQCNIRMAPPPPGSAPATTPSNNGGGGGVGPISGKKVSLAWGGSPDQIANFVTPHVRYLYNWSPNPPQEARDHGLEILPMFWGTRDIDAFQQYVVEGYAQTILGFNEPNEPGQCNLNPWDAAGIWKQYIQPKKALGYNLIGPAMSSNPNGLTWTSQFFQACDGCTFDGLAVHWYDVDAYAFIAYIQNYHNTFNLPIWVTEFACQNYNGGAQCSMDYIYEFMGIVTSFMEQQDWVVMYCAFGAMIGLPDGVNQDNELMGWDGKPTNLGYQFLWPN